MLLAAASVLLPLCSGWHAPLVSIPTRAPVTFAKATAAAPTKTNPAQQIAQSLAVDESVNNLKEPQTWRWIDGQGRPADSFEHILDAIRESEATRESVEVHVACDSARQVCRPGLMMDSTPPGYPYARAPLWVDDRLETPVATPLTRAPIFVGTGCPRHLRHRCLRHFARQGRPLLLCETS